METAVPPGSGKYEVTATKYRPQSLDELAGQEFVVSTLKNSLESGRIAHAYLFSGPRGCGKTSAARILARSLNCEKGPTASPCGVCSACSEIRTGTSLDVIEIDGASNTSVNDVRQIKDEVLFPPNAGRYKVYIIDEVHMLSNNAFNALLKTIEEPPSYIVFIFATTEIHKVPATIKSRCQQFNFRLIPIETIQGLLKQICGGMGIEAEEEALFWIARESGGSLRDAFTLFDQVVSFSEGHIKTALIREKLGLLGLEKLNALAEACAAGDISRAFNLTDEALSGGIAIEQFIVDLAGYYRSLLLLKNGVTREALLGAGKERFSAQALESLDSTRIEEALRILLDCYRDIRYTLSPRFDLETAVSRLSRLKDWISPAEMLAALEEARRALNAGGRRSGGTPPNSNTAAGTGGPLPLADGASAGPRKTESPLPEAADGGTIRFNRPGALTESFKRLMASREKGGSAAAPEWGNRQEEETDDEPPLWDDVVRPESSAGQTKAGEGFPPPDGAVSQGGSQAEYAVEHDRNSAESQTGGTQAIPPQAERVLRMFEGTIVSRRTDEH
ncbi:MAG: DNA polymerase III subunit gamma/tau [Treponema sp.]|nr:DNA polymerase III subunit gamma/tau [Treponema sp.]